MYIQNGHTTKCMASQNLPPWSHEKNQLLFVEGVYGYALILRLHSVATKKCPTHKKLYIFVATASVHRVRHVFIVAQHFVGSRSWPISADKIKLLQKPFQRKNQPTAKKRLGNIKQKKLNRYKTTRKINMNNDNRIQSTWATKCPEQNP